MNYALVVDQRRIVMNGNASQRPSWGQILPMDKDSIGRALMAAEEFIERAKIVLSAGEAYDAGPLATGALRRQSMELTRALAGMRRP